MQRYYFERLKTIDRLIRIKGTGCPQQLAQRIGISERSLYGIITLMKEMGAPICYCRHRLSYYYEEEGEFCIKFLRTK